MELSDISSEAHSSRTRRNLVNLFGEDLRFLSYDELRTGENLATAEMLDEIHLMLRSLLKLKED
jgi:hypothetical protein